MQTLINFSIQQAQNKDTRQIKELLLQVHLPIVDLGDELPNFLTAKIDDQVIGCIGLEIVGKEALLRSFAVKEEFRNQQVGKQLYEAIMNLAKEKSIDRVYLITTTAENYFGKLRFEKINRSDAPSSIAQTRQFSSICSSSGIVMTKVLR